MAQVEGLAKLQARYAAIPQRIRAEVTAAMEKAAGQIVTDMKRIAPRDQGDLAASIAWTWGDAPKGSLVIGSLGGGSSYGALRITIYAGGGKAFYARFQEFGTQNMVPHPFFFPVWRVWRRRVQSRIRAAIRRGLRAA